MNYRYVITHLGLLAVVLSTALAVISAVAGLRHVLGDAGEIHALAALAITAASGLAVGGSAWLIGRRPGQRLENREALLLVAASWLGGAALAGLPYLLWAHLSGAEGHPFRSFVNCYFEAMSGLTTTGATVLSNIEALPRSILLWRALTHWLGGLGIIVLFVAVLPSLGVGGKRLFRVEAPGPAPEGVRPHIRETARALWLIYLGLTIAQVLALMATGVTAFDAVCHTFATLATGGFSTKDASVGGLHNLASEIVIILFMVLAGANFGLYYQLYRRRIKVVLRDTELRFYLALLLIGSAIVCGSLMTQDRIMLTDRTYVDTTVGQSIRHGVFKTVSIHTTTGFCTSDFNQWTDLAKAVLVGLMFVGGCAGSTGGGIKVIRVWIVLRVLLVEVERAFRPNVVRPVRINGVTLSPEMRLTSLAFALGMIGIFAIGAVTVLCLERGRTDFETAATASVATLCTIGPGLGRIGAVENYNHFGDPAKLVLSLLMVLGRLEIMAIAVLLSPRFWGVN